VVGGESIGGGNGKKEEGDGGVSIDSVWDDPRILGGKGLVN